MGKGGKFFFSEGSTSTILILLMRLSHDLPVIDTVIPKHFVWIISLVYARPGSNNYCILTPIRVAKDNPLYVDPEAVVGDGAEAA